MYIFSLASIGFLSYFHKAAPDQQYHTENGQFPAIRVPRTIGTKYYVKHEDTHQAPSPGLEILKECMHAWVYVHIGEPLGPLPICVKELEIVVLLLIKSGMEPLPQGSLDHTAVFQHYVSV